MNTLHPWQPEAELAAWKQLSSALIQEQVMLRAGDSDALTDLATLKRNLVVALAPHIKARGRLLQENGCPTTEGGMEALIKQSGRQETALIWKEIRESERMARDLNQINGRLINMRLSTVELALNVLSSAAGGQRLYNPGGQASYDMRAKAVPV